MKKEVITTAKTIEEAVALAVRELGAPDADKIQYTVLEEPKKGLFGIGATYVISIIASAIVKGLIGIPNIAFLEPSHAVLLVCLSVFLTLISGVMPARSAAKKDPVVALRTE